MSHLLPLESDSTEEILQPTESENKAGTKRAWRMIAAVSALTAVVLTATAHFTYPMTPSSEGEDLTPKVPGEDLEHLTQLSAADDLNKDASLGFPIYFSAGLATATAKKTWLITLKGPGIASKKAKLKKMLGDKIVFASESLPMLVMEGKLSELKDAIKGFPANSIDFAEQDQKWVALPENPKSHPEHHESRRLRQGNAPWGLDRIDERDLPLDSAFDAKGEGAGVHVYVLDTGIRTSHDDFGGRAIPTVETFGDRNKVCNPSDRNCAKDRNGHGTHCAGTVAGAKFGVAKKAKVHAVKVLGDRGGGSTRTVLAGIDHVIKRGAKPSVISMSLGGPGKSPSSEKVVNDATSKGITVVVAAGNENSDACNYSPAHIASAVTVGSTTSRDMRSGFSNFGSCLDLFAPGSSIKSAGVRSDGAEATLSGTSMACPHVSGAIALLLAQNPRKTPQQLTAELLQHATPNKIRGAKGSANELLFAGKEGDVPTPAPPGPPAAADCSSAGWKVIKGSECVIDSNCCLTVKTSRSKYRNSKECKVRLGSRPGQIEQAQFRTEAGYDELTVPIDNEDHVFSGAENVEVEPDKNGIITWTSDYSVTKKGFKLCMKLPSSPSPAQGVKWTLGEPRESCTAACKNISKRCDEKQLKSVGSKDGIESAAKAAGRTCKSTRSWAYNHMPGVCTSPDCCGGSCIDRCAYGDTGTRTCAGVAQIHYSRLCPCV